MCRKISNGELIMSEIFDAMRVYDVSDVRSATDIRRFGSSTSTFAQMA